jgi:hypothetical protein
MNDLIKPLQAALGLKPDGARGPVTTAAILDAADDGRLSVAPAVTSAPHAAGWPSQSGVTAFYGPSGGTACTAGRCDLPFAFPLAWDLDQRVTRFSCHEKVAGAMTGIFKDAAAQYGEAEFRRLRLDRFGGCFNVRAMRGGSAMSMHSWGIAVDLDPENNQLKWGSDKATFARPEYDPFWKIVEATGAVSLGRKKNFDWMHWEFTNL